MSATTTMSTINLEQLGPCKPCAKCDNQAADLICTCGKAYDFACIQEHIMQITDQTKECAGEISTKYSTISALPQHTSHEFEAARRSINRLVRISSV